MTTRPLFLSLICLFSFPALTGCAEYMPVPGGHETTNETFYESEEDFLISVGNLRPGMTQQQVLSILRRKEKDFVTLNRSQIVDALYGGSETELQQSASGQESGNYFLQTLSGYSLNYKVVEQEHGFSSPIRIQTDKTGYEYTLCLIFKDGILFEKPILSGGDINKKRSSTVFDYISPTIIINRGIE